MRIGRRRIDRSEPPFIIAEIGVNHDGEVERALELVRRAAACGADAVKLQWFEAERLLGREARLASYQEQAGEEDPVDMLRRLELSRDDFARLVDEARAINLAAIVTVFSIETVGAASELEWDAFKLASPDVVNRPLIEEIAACGRPMILSTGGATMDEVRSSLRWIDRRRTMYMQCVSSYPTPPARAALGAIRELAHETRLPIGYSDHTEDVETGGFAVATGAVALEKHLTDDRGRRGPDHRVSLDPDSFAAYARGARRAWEMVGPEEKLVQDIEREVRVASRQSVVATRDLPAGHALERHDLTVMRPGVGVSPARLRELIGARLRRPVGAKAALRRDDIAPAGAPAGGEKISA